MQQQIINMDSTVNLKRQDRQETHQSKKDGEKREKFAINIAQHAEFKSSESLEIGSARDINGLITDILSNVFADYHGTVCIHEQVEAYGGFFPALVPHIVFNITQPDSNDGRVRAVKPFNPSTEDSFERVKRLGSNEISVEFTQEFKDAFAPYTLKNSKHGTFVYKTKVSQEGVFVEITNIDINGLLRLIYGTGDQGENYEYALSVIKAKESTYMNAVDWVINIRRINNKLIQEEASKVMGAPLNPNSIFGPGFEPARR